MATRINKWLSEMGICSRKQADRLIKQQRVTVNGESAFLGMLIAEHDFVEVENRPVKQRPKPVYLLYHKPVGVVCSHAPYLKNGLAQAIDYPQRVFAVGRLDKASEGLLLLTNQGDIVNPIMQAEYKQPKFYRVWVDKPLTEEFIKQMAEGVEILNQRTLPCQVIKISSHELEIVLKQGLNLQIRRMCKVLGYRVLRLQRFGLMDFTLDELAEGQMRELTEQEVERLLKQLALNNKPSIKSSQ